MGCSKQRYYKKNPWVWSNMIEWMDFDVEELMEKWERTKLLEGIEDKDIKEKTLLFLEGQRLLNEMISDYGDIDPVTRVTTSNHQRFKRISIPMIRRVIPNLKCHEYVDLKPSLDLTLPKFTMCENIDPPSKEDYKNHMYSLDVEANYTAKVCISMVKKLDDLILGFVGPIPETVSESDFGLIVTRKPRISMTPILYQKDESLKVGIKVI